MQKGLISNSVPKLSIFLIARSRLFRGLLFMFRQWWAAASPTLLGLQNLLPCFWWVISLPHEEQKRFCTLLPFILMVRLYNLSFSPLCKFVQFLKRFSHSVLISSFTQCCHLLPCSKTNFLNLSRW